jgi:hypothetical protein
VCLLYLSPLDAGESWELSSAVSHDWKICVSSICPVIIIVDQGSSNWSNWFFLSGRAFFFLTLTGHVNLLDFFSPCLKANVKQREASETLTFYRIRLEDNNVLASCYTWRTDLMLMKCVAQVRTGIKWNVCLQLPGVKCVAIKKLYPVKPRLVHPKTPKPNLLRFFVT